MVLDGRSPALPLTSPPTCHPPSLPHCAVAHTSSHSPARTHPLKHSYHPFMHRLFALHPPTTHQFIGLFTHLSFPSVS